MLTVSLIDKNFEDVPAGTPMVQLSLYTILQLCQTNLKNDFNKGSHGQIVPYINNRFGMAYWPDNTIYNDHVGFLDLDYMTKESTEKIYDAFEQICMKCPYVLGIQYSASYYNPEKEKNGLHIFVCMEAYNQHDYKRNIRYIFAVVCRVILNVTGIDVRQPQLFKDSKGLKIIDDTCCKITQKCNLYYSTFKWNENYDFFDESVLTTDVKVKLREEYAGYIFAEEKEQTTLKTVINADNYEILYPNKESVKIDRFLNINGNTGNSIRYKICSIFNILFNNNDLSRNYINRYFVDGEGKSFYQANQYVLYDDILSWLIAEGYIKDKNQPELYHSKDGYEVNTYLSNEYKDLIIDNINNHKCITINGETGIGKTVCFSQINKEMNGIMLVPYLSMRKLYEEQGITIVERSNQDDFTFAECCVMVYDRLSLISDDKIFGKAIFIDESHILFTDRKLRQRLIEVIEKVKRCAAKIIIISATPLEETKIFNSEIELKFTKPRKYINLFWKNVENVNAARMLIEGIVDKNIKENIYDRVCIFTNRCSRYVYDNLLVRYTRSIHNNVNIFHREYEEFGDIERVTKNEILDKKINIGTSLIYNGLNFNNTESNILVVIEWIKGETSYAEIIQAAGRFRKAGITVYIVGINSEAEIDDEFSKQNAQILSKLNLDKKLFSYDNDYIVIPEVVEELFQFRKHECTKERVISKLNEAGYFIINEIEEKLNDDGFNRKNLLKEKIDLIIKKELMNESLSPRECHLKIDGMEYYNAEVKMINWFMFKYHISAEQLINLNKSEMINSTNKVKYQRLNSTIDKLEKIILASLDDEEYWHKVSSDLKNEWNNINNERIIKKQGSELKKAMNYNKKYHKYFDQYENRDLKSENVYTTLINDLIKDNTIKNEDKSKKRAEAGKKTAKIEVTNNMPGKLINKYKLKVGKKFTSRTEMSEYCGVNPKQVTTWVNLHYINKI